MSGQNKREIVDVIFPGGFCSVDASNCWEQGLLDGPEPETTGEVLLAVKNAIKAGNSLLTLEGWPVLFPTSTDPVLVYRTEPA